MAERRMFSKSVVQAGRFLRMPATARLLYYDLGMAADDDGVAEAFAVLRFTGAAEDDLRVLASRGFITVLNEDLVCRVNDWQRNNLIRRDRYQPSIYRALLPDGADAVPAEGGKPDDAVSAEGGKPDDAVSAADGYPNDALRSTDGKPDDAIRSTQDRSGKDRSGKDRSEKDRTDQDDTGERRGGAARGKTAPRFSPPSPEEVAAYCQERKNAVDPKRFIDFYASKGWKVGREPMRDWKAAVRTWESRDRQSAPARASPAGAVKALPTREEYEKGWEDYYA